MNCECLKCWYCEFPFFGKHEHDHVRPKRHEGESIVPICMNCHNLKDRTVLEDWPLATVFNALLSVPAGPARVLLAKLYGLGLDLAVTIAEMDRVRKERVCDDATG